MKGRVGRLITSCLLVSIAGLLPLTAACQRAKPGRTVAPLPVTPRVETPVIARVAMATVTAIAAAASGYPEPSTPTAVGAQDAYPPIAETPTEVPPTAVPPEPTEVPTVAPTPTSTGIPTVAPIPEIAPPTPLPEIAYRVKAGDSVGSIAVLFNSTTSAILARNRLSDASLVRVGQTLIIPAASPQSIPTGSIIQHSVQAGETLDVVASYYRTTPGAILALNASLSGPDDLDVGMVLTVIAGSQAPPRTHVVKVGESLSLIAESYGITTQALSRANGLTDPSRIRVGQTLIVP